MKAELVREILTRPRRPKREGLASTLARLKKTCVTCQKRKTES